MCTSHIHEQFLQVGLNGINNYIHVTFLQGTEQYKPHMMCFLLK